MHHRLAPRAVGRRADGCSLAGPGQAGAGARSPKPGAGDALAAEKDACELVPETRWLVQGGHMPAAAGASERVQAVLEAAKASTSSDLRDAS